MEDAKRSLSREWLLKAMRDLGSARKLADDPDPFLDTSVYHCQQAGEKALKGFLVYHDRCFEKTHDIRALLAEAVPLNDRLICLNDAAEVLTPYAVLFRYPDVGPLAPTAEQFKRAVAAAERIYRFVLSLCPELDPNS